MKQQDYSAFDYYLDTIHFVKDIFDQESEEEADYAIAELEGDHYTFLHSITVDKLLADGIINNSIAEKSELLRTMLIALYEKSVDLQDVRQDPEWKKAYSLADSILVEIKNHRS